MLLREGLTRLLEEAGHEVVAAEPDAERFLRAVAADPPDAAVIDVRMPPTFTDEGCGPRWWSATAGRRRRAGALPVGRGTVRDRAHPAAPHGVGYLSRTGSPT